MGLLKWIAGFLLVAIGLAMMVFLGPCSIITGNIGVVAFFIVGGLVILAIGTYLLRHR